MGSNEKLLNKLEKTYGKNLKFGLDAYGLETLSTGSLELDVALGIGGWPAGRICALAGNESSGKSTLSMMAIANTQRMGKKAALIDTEHSFSPQWAKANGVNLKELIMIRAFNFEAAADACVDLANDEDAPSTIIFDSLAGAPMKVEEEGEVGDTNIGKKARIMSTFMPKLAGPVARNNIWMLFTNQIRPPIGMYDKPHMPGGKALYFQSSIVVFLRSKKNEDRDGIEVTATVEKNKIAPPFREAKFELLFEDQIGIDLKQSIANILTDGKLSERLSVQRNGAWYSLPKELLPEGENKINGQGKIIDLLTQNPDYIIKFENYIKNRLTADPYDMHEE